MTRRGDTIHSSKSVNFLFTEDVQETTIDFYLKKIAKPDVIRKVFIEISWYT